MTRSKVLSGKLQQRNRAHLRGKLDYKTKKDKKEQNTKEIIFDWIKININASDIDMVETIDLKQYLYDTGHIKIDSDERLRKLAIYLDEEESIWQLHDKRTWLAFERIYKYALVLNSKNVDLHHSRAITSQRISKCVQDDDKQIKFVKKIDFNSL